MQFWSSHDESMDSPEPWRYGDEASLYSIAEDSREDRVSVSANGALGASNGTLDAAARQGISNEVSSNATPGVELCVADEDFLTRKPSDEIFYFHHKPHGSRRKCQMIGIACIVCTLAGGIVATVLLTQFNRMASESRSSAAINNGEENTDGQVAAAADEDADSRLAMAETHVFNSLNQCLGASDALLDPQTPNGRIYESLVQEVFDGATIDGVGMVVFAELHGEEFLQERYALEMLYDSTNGDDWTNSGGWEIGSTVSDPCSWYGISCERPRILGSCAVTSVELDNNNLSGELPREFCCLPCVKSVAMNDNRIGGPVRACLNTISTLKSVGFANNEFDSFENMGGG